MIEFLEGLKEAAPAMGAMVATLSAIVAFIAFSHTRTVARRRATLDMVLKTFVDEEGQARYIKFKETMQKHKDGVIDILDFADPDCRPSEDRQTIRTQLNEYELIALGIRRKVFDESLYKLWFQDQFERDYRSLEGFIDRVRGHRNSVFCECVWLYTRWSRTPHPENRPARWKLIWWAVTRNEARLSAYADSAP